MGTVDLHIHTTASDGTLTPAEVVDLAKSLGLEAIAITDHDTAAGAGPGVAAGLAAGLEVIPGIEVSVDFRGREIHILGYFIDPEDPALQPVLDWVVEDRDRRNEKIVGMLERDGYGVSLAALKRENPGAVIGRPHIARALLAGGHVSSVNEAFDRFLAEGKPYFLPRAYLPLQQAMDSLRTAGGVAVLAHPLWWGFEDSFLRDMIAAVKAAGVVGMEVQYSTYTPEQTAYAMTLAEEFGLLPTGGSDFHGDAKPEVRMGVGMGDLNVPRAWLDSLRARRNDMTID